MAGIWKIERTKRGIGVHYRDFDTGKDFTCGRAPPEMPMLNVLSWITERISRADVIEIDGYPFVCDFGQHIFNPLLQ